MRKNSRPDIIRVSRRHYRNIGSISLGPVKDLAIRTNTRRDISFYTTHPILWQQPQMRGFGFLPFLIPIISAIASAVATVVSIVAQIIATIGAIVAAVVAKVVALIGAIMEFVGLGQLWSGIIEVYQLGAGWMSELTNFLVGGLDALTGGLASDLFAAVQLPTLNIPGLNIPGLDKLDLMDGVRFGLKRLGVPMSPQDLVEKAGEKVVRATPIGNTVLDAGNFVGDMSAHENLSDALNDKAADVAQNTLESNIQSATGIPVSSLADAENAANALSDPDKLMSEIEDAQATASSAIANANPLNAASNIMDQASGVISPLQMNIPSPEDLVRDSNIASQFEQRKKELEAKAQAELEAARARGEMFIKQLSLDDILLFAMQFLLPGETFDNIPQAKRDMILSALYSQFPDWEFPAFDFSMLEGLRKKKSNVIPVMLVGGAALVGAFVVLGGND